MVGAGDPERLIPAHSFIAGYNIFNRDKKSVSGVEAAVRIGRWHNDTERFLIIRVGFRIESPRRACLGRKKTAFFPKRVYSFLGFFRFVWMKQFFVYHFLLSYHI